MARTFQDSRSATCAHFVTGCCPFTGGVCRDGLRSVSVRGAIWKCPNWKSRKRSAAALRRWHVVGNIGRKKRRA